MHRPHTNHISHNIATPKLPTKQWFWRAVIHLTLNKDGLFFTPHLSKVRIIGNPRGLVPMITKYQPQSTDDTYGLCLIMLPFWMNEVACSILKLSKLSMIWFLHPTFGHCECCLRSRRTDSVQPIANTHELHHISGCDHSPPHHIYMYMWTILVPGISSYRQKVLMIDIEVAVTQQADGDYIIVPGADRGRSAA